MSDDKPITDEERQQVYLNATGEILMASRHAPSDVRQLVEYAVLSDRDLAALRERLANERVRCAEWLRALAVAEQVTDGDTKDSHTSRWLMQAADDLENGEHDKVAL